MPEEQKQVRVLLVDDEDDFRAALSRRLNKRGLALDQASGGREALEILSRKPVEVVVLDVKMPDMDGLTTLGRIKQAHPQVEVILLTGQVSAQDGVSGILAGAFDYLSKPVEIEHLMGKIGQAHDKILRVEEQAREADFRAKMEQRMAAAERLASLGTMAAGVAHEINNPLAIISEAAGWLKSRLGKEEALPEALKSNFQLALSKIETGVERAKRITHQLLSFARKADSLIQEFDLRDLINEVMELTRKTASGNNIEILTDIAADRTRIWSDPYQLRQVLINIVNNALQALESDGKIWLRLSGGRHEVQLTIQDNGPGIPKENLQRIFEPFFSTKPPGQGTGLGLSVSRGIVEKLGGRIEVESQLGAGAAFSVVLPRQPITAAAQPTAAGT